MHEWKHIVTVLAFVWLLSIKLLSSSLVSSTECITFFRGTFFIHLMDGIHYTYHYGLICKIKHIKKDDSQAVTGNCFYSLQSPLHSWKKSNWRLLLRSVHSPQSCISYLPLTHTLKFQKIPHIKYNLMILRHIMHNFA